jgi:hypothetical protein
MAAEVLFVLALQHVAGRAETDRENILDPTTTANPPLHETPHLLHHPQWRIAQDFDLDHPAVNQATLTIVAPHSELIS